MLSKRRELVYFGGVEASYQQPQESGVPFDPFDLEFHDIVEHGGVEAQTVLAKANGMAGFGFELDEARADGALKNDAL
jgi:hypothetical protein